MISLKRLWEKETFCEEVSTCLKSFEKEGKFIMMGYMSAKVEDECVMDVMRKWEKLRKNENGVAGGHLC